MSFLGTLFGIGAAEAGKTIATPIEAIGNAIDKVFTSDQERMEARAVLMKLAQQPGALQVELNKVEAQHSSMFVAGWRPWIGWVCGVSLALYYWPQFTLATVLWVRASWAASELVPYPVGQIEGLMELVVAMLGIASLRSIDKALGTEK